MCAAFWHPQIMQSRTPIPRRLLRVAVAELVAGDAAEAGWFLIGPARGSVAIAWECGDFRLGF